VAFEYSVDLNINNSGIVVTRQGDIILNTLLTRFMNDKIANYAEPTRKGTPRGEDVGYSRTKYVANLLGITNLKGKQIARLTGIPYGTLRNWGLEPSFRGLERDLCLEFATYLLNFMIVKLKEFEKKLEVDVETYQWQYEDYGELIIKDRHEEDIKRALDKILKHRPKLTFDEVADASLYGNCIIENVLASFLKDMDRVEKEADKMEKEEFYQVAIDKFWYEETVHYFIILDVLIGLFSKIDTMSDFDKYNSIALWNLGDIANWLKGSLAKKAKRILMLKQTLSKQDKTALIAIMTLLESG